MHATADDLTVLLHDDAGTDVLSTDWDDMAANFSRVRPRHRPRSPSRPAPRW